MFRSGAKFTDEEFVLGLRNENAEALEALYKKHFGSVLKFIVNNSGTREEARDIFQDTMIILVENVRKPEFALTSQLQTYIYSIAKRLWLKQLRSRHKAPLLKEEWEQEVPQAEEDAESYLTTEEAYSKMEKSLIHLGEPCSTLLGDFYIGRLSMDEITQKFGYTSADSAKNQKYKCLQRLKRLFFEVRLKAEEADK
jgi:RNA polymerase sigma factor (sigma-70 family)